MEKLRHEARWGHSPAEGPAERQVPLLAGHGTPRRVSVFGAVPPRAAGVQLYLQHPDGLPGPFRQRQRKTPVSMAAAPLLQTFTYSLKINPSQRVSRQTSLNSYATYGFINSSDANTPPASGRKLQTCPVMVGSEEEPCRGEAPSGHAELNLTPEDAALPQGQEQKFSRDEYRTFTGQDRTLSWTNPI